MFGVNKYDFKYLMDKIVKPEESFINLYAGKCFESEITINTTRWMHRILDANYKNENPSYKRS